VTDFCNSITGEVVTSTFFGEDFGDKWNQENKDIKVEIEFKNLITLLSSVARYKSSYRLRAAIFGQHFYENNVLLTKEEKNIKKRLLHLR